MKTLALLEAGHQEIDLKTNVSRRKNAINKRNTRAKIKGSRKRQKQVMKKGVECFK